MLCRVCGTQYVGSRTERFRFRWNIYKANQRKAKKGKDHTQMYFHDRFLSHDRNGHINDTEIIFTHKTDRLDPTSRAEFLQAKLKKLTPNRLNTEE